MRKLDRQNDSLLQRLLRTLQTCHILPLNVRLIRQNCTRQRASQLLAIRVLFLIVSLFPRAIARFPIRSHRGGLSFTTTVIFR